MDEYIDLLDVHGNTTGERCLKSVAHKNGYYHASVHIWFYTKDQQILLQQRKATKDTFPNLWDVSVAGHIGYGELPILAACREISEEIGYNFQKENLFSIGTCSHKKKHSKDLIDFELHHLYLGELILTIDELKIQEEEVAAIELIPIDTLISELNSPLTKTKYVPHGEAYYHRIFSEIKKRF